MFAHITLVSAAFFSMTKNADMLKKGKKVKVMFITYTKAYSYIANGLMPCVLQ